jgi:DNA-binding IclR family transcriptional regulator
MSKDHSTDGEARGRDATVKTVERIGRILRQLAIAGEAGARLTDLANELDLTKPTLHRLLGALAEAGMARHEPATRRYRLGELSAMLGRASTRITVSTEVRQNLVRLAAATKDTVYATIQEGTAAICIAREIGSFPIRTLTLDVGDQRPLGVGAGSMALLAFLPDDEVDTAIARNRIWLEKYPRFTPDFLREQVRETRARGYALNRDQVIPGMSAIGVPALGRDHLPIAAISVAGITERIIGDREAHLVEIIRTETAHLAAAVETGSSISLS